MFYEKHTWLYSSSQVSSSQADSHLSTLSMISFRVRDSSFAAAICASMLERSLQGSTRPVRGNFLDYPRYLAGAFSIIFTRER
jgi:hypothetical protein